MTKPLQIFRPGRHTDSRGVAIEFTEAMVKGIADAYDTGVHEAPIVVGHPKDNAPAFGWVGSLKYSDGLDAYPRQVHQEFAEMVKQGRFKKVSASLYTPNAPGNPKPGSYYLRHLGFLGAVPPAIKGLRPAEFAGGEEGVIEFVEDIDRINSAVLLRMVAWIRKNFGDAAADFVFPGSMKQQMTTVFGGDLSQISRIGDRGEARQDEGATDRNGGAGGDGGIGGGEQPRNGGGVSPGNGDAGDGEDPSISPPPGDPNDPPSTPPLPGDNPPGLDIAPGQGTEEAQLNREEALAKREENIKKRENKVDMREAQLRKQAATDFVEGLVKEGKVLPAEQAGLVEYLCGIDERAVVEFEENDKEVKKSASEWLREFLEGALTKRVEYKETTASKGSPVSVKDDPEAIAAMARDYREDQRGKGNHITAAQAVRHVTREMNR